ncbi:MAG: hypothetical protein ABSF58_04185 [Solirubrobacteraceae bacterium]|jgi:hypothetical protein
MREAHTVAALRIASQPLLERSGQLGDGDDPQALAHTAIASLQMPPS